ncbi:MAG: fumarylacetoacetate hydrolase family protein [Anaerolineales bacterium]|nr:fumarylacetoacetate hydrolase family protein [Anaerolineales bacterium]
MRYARFLVDGKTHSGVIEGETVFELKGGDVLGCAQAYENIIDGNTTAKSDNSWRINDVKLLAPVLPSKLIAMGLNYRAHAEEFGFVIPEDPMVLLKPTTAIIGIGDEIVYPSHMSRRVDCEAELGIVISKRAKNLSIEDAKDYILGYTCVNDVTARDLQKSDGQFIRAKAFDTFAPIGPWIESDIDPENLSVESYVNGELRESGHSSDMAKNVFEVVSFVSKIMTLLPGDVIATGTPSGNGKMKPGDEVEIRIEGIGSLTNTVVVNTFIEK